MTDRPIIFSAPMVRALLAGRKTQTRRVLRPGRFAKQRGYEHLRLDVLDGHLWWWGGVHDRVGVSQPFPYAPGDRLWVRETWTDYCLAEGEVIFRATAFDDTGYTLDEIAEIRWKSSRCMPRWASRLTLTVTDVRVQRVQEISEADAVAEGVTRCAWAESMADDGRLEWHVPEHTPGEYPGMTNAYPAPQSAFWELWDHINGPGAWAANPWVCALTFTVQRGNIDAVSE